MEWKPDMAGLWVMVVVATRTAEAAVAKASLILVSGNCG